MTKLHNWSKASSPLLWLWLTAIFLVSITLITPRAFEIGGHEAYIAFAFVAGLLAIIATFIVVYTPVAHTLWLVLCVAAALRIFLLFTDPLLSTDVYRYVWDGKVQASGINPYRFVPADDALAHLRDTDILPYINRAGYAVTIYPPVAQMFFFLVTRFGESVTTMKAALLICEAGTIATVMLLLRQLGQPVTRIVAYVWHPLPLWEIANNGHIDGLMVTLMMASIFLTLSDKRIHGAILIALGALAKPFAILAMPALWRPWDWKVPLAMIAVIVLCYLPYLSVGWGVFGFLTTGYLSEESLVGGDRIWLLAMWRQVFGMLPGDTLVYLAMSALILAALSIAALRRTARTPETILTDTMRLLLAFLLLLSPSYPWYFVILTPFVALLGGAVLWAVTLGALFLQLNWDASAPILTRKTILYSMVFAACALTWWQAWHRRNRTVSNEYQHAK